MNQRVPDRRFPFRTAIIAAPSYAKQEVHEGSPACLDPHLTESLGLSSSRPPTGSRRDRRIGGPERDESRIRGRSYWNRATGAIASSSPPRRGHRASIRLHLRGRSWHRRGSHVGMWGRSGREQTVPRGGSPSARRHRERRNGCEARTPTGTRGSSSPLPPRAVRTAVRAWAAANRNLRLGAVRKANRWSSYAGAVACASALRSRSRVSPSQSRTNPSPNCAGSGKVWATKRPGRLGHPGFFWGIPALSEAQSFFTASVSAGTTSKRSATRK
jgi:hypothetical protein